MDRYDVVVLGAGPAGLSAAAELGHAGVTSCLLVEQGAEPEARSHEDPTKLLEGVGGAGLFSDGKHSLFPSATALWELPAQDALRLAFEHTAADLAPSGVVLGAFPEGSAAPLLLLPGVWQHKPYASHYATLADRRRCIESLWSRAPARAAHTRLRAARQEGERSLVLELEHRGASREVRCASLLVAAGRWSPLWLLPTLAPLGVRSRFLRVDFGVRVQAAAEHPLFAALPGVDAKLCLAEGGPSGVEFRTFCTCRRGEVVLASASGLRAFSGRADGSPSSSSSVGLLARTRSEPLGRSVLRAMERSTPERVRLAEVLAAGPLALASHFGEEGAAALSRGLAHLAAFCPSVQEPEVELFAPCLEGVGAYPALDGDLRAAPGVYFAGDACGLFRGLVASMLSGRYAALRLLTAGALSR